MKNSPSFTGIVTSLAILSAGCSGTQLFEEEKTCDQRADEYANTLYDIDIMLSAANTYQEMIKSGSPTAVSNAEELRTKVLAKFELIAESLWLKQLLLLYSKSKISHFL